MNFGIDGLPDLNELALERLATGVEVFTSCSADSDMSSGPAYVAMMLTTKTLETIMKAVKSCVENKDWNSIELNKYPSRTQADFVESDGNLDIDAWSLHVDVGAIQWRGTDKHSSETVSGRHIGLKSLLGALNVEPEAIEFPEDMKWLGPVLVYSPSDVQALCETIGEDIPEIDANAKAAEMHKVISSSVNTETVASAEPVARARRQRL